MRSQKMRGRGTTGQVCVVWAAFFALMLTPGGHSALRGGAVHAETLPETMSEAGVLEFLTAHSITTVEGFVAALPPLHKRNFLAVFDSESPSAAHISAAHPRIVSWGADARFIVTWTTNPADPAADQVEFLRPVPAEGEWAAGALDFTGERPQLVRSPSSGRTACSQCHSALNRPVWGNDNLGEGTENEVQTVESQPTHCTLATTMLTTADRRLTPLEREGYRSSPRRSIAFPGRGGQAPNWEFGTTLGLRHAEVLFTRLKARSDYAAVAEARMCNTQTAASLFSKEEYDLSLLSTAGTHVQGAPVTTPAQAGEYVGGSVRLGGTLDFLILYDLYQSREAVQQLYQTTSNREMFLEGVSASFRLDSLRYAEGAATAEAELLALYTENFELQGQAYLAERARRGVNPRYSGSVLSHHAGDFRGKVCSRLGGGEEERQSGVRDAGSFGDESRVRDESSFGDAGSFGAESSFGDESGVRDAGDSEAGRCSFGEEARSEDALVAATATATVVVAVVAPRVITPPVITPPAITPPGMDDGGTGDGGTGDGGTGDGGTGGGGTGGGGTGGGGTGGDPVTLPPGYLENPGADSFQSGVGLLSGWVCDADMVEIELNGMPQEAAYGTERLDTLRACGDTDNGFGLLFNWNLLSDGEHEVVALVDGVELGRATVTVTTLGSEFLRGAEGECVVEDFPAMGQTVTLEWQQTSQNFVIAGGSAPARAHTGTRPSGLTGFLENPGPNSFQSGVGVISGWVCEAEAVELAIGTGRQAAAYGTERLDTLAACGDTDNGFGLLFNWNLLGDGEHTVVAYVDEEELGRATVRVTTLGQEFLREAEGECVVEDFPRSGQNVLLEWQQDSQNFVVTDVE